MDICRVILCIVNLKDEERRDLIGGDGRRGYDSYLRLHISVRIEYSHYETALTMLNKPFIFHKWMIYTLALPNRCFLRA